MLLQTSKAMAKFSAVQAKPRSLAAPFKRSGLFNRAADVFDPYWNTSMDGPVSD